MATVPTLAVCCVCKQVPESDAPLSRWTPMPVYLEEHHLRPKDVRLSHTYCPACYELQVKAWALPPQAPRSRTTKPF